MSGNMTWTVNIALRRHHFLHPVFRVLLWLFRLTPFLSSSPSPHHYELVVFFGYSNGVNENGSPDMRDTFGGVVSSFWGRSRWRDPLAIIEAYFRRQQGLLAVKEFFPNMPAEQTAPTSMWAKTWVLPFGQQFYRDDTYEYSLISVIRDDDVHHIWRSVSPPCNNIILPDGSTSDVRVVDDYKLNGNCCADRAIRVAQQVLPYFTPQLVTWMDYTNFCRHFRGQDYCQLPWWRSI